MSKRQPSMFDVAKKSGVSHQTVSRVINDHPNVSEKTRQKVLLAIKNLGYRPNHVARMLATGKTSTIGVLSHDTTLFGPASVLHAVQFAGRELGYAVSLISLKSIYPEEVIAGIQELADLGAEGVIIIAPQSAEYKILKRTSRELPAVIIEGGDVAAIPSVEVDQFLGARIAVEHLIRLGHKNIAHISGPQGWFSSERRLEGWKAALADANLKYSTIMEGDWSPRSGYLATKEILKDGKITSIFSANDDMALGALKAINEAGLAIPEEFSLIGFDDAPASAYLTPGLTTIHQDFDEVGKQALSLLLTLVRGEKLSKRRVTVTPELIIRDSTGKPPRR